MNSRHTRAPSRSQSALIHRGPQAMNAAPQYAAPIHAPNAALLIDFDNVTMGIRSDLGKELRSLLSSEIIKGKVAVQRAYADWRRYPQYIVPLTEASIDLIYAPAYGSSKKNATDIRLAIDALELVFVRPEIGTFILLSGDSDFSSLVIKLKEYGKYVIGVGIRESSSDLLVMNCDEYYSYNALAGLVKASDEEGTVRKYDPWELVTEAVQRMKRNNDVMRSDRLKQVMQEIDNTFDEKNLGISKFSRFCQEAAQRGLLTVTKLDNGQLEVDTPSGTAETPVRAATQPAGAATPSETGETPAPSGEERGSRRGRRGRGGRGRDREEREPRGEREPRPTPIAATAEPAVEPEAPPTPIVETRPADITAGNTGERLTRQEAFDLLRRSGSRRRVRARERCALACPPTTWSRLRESERPHVRPHPQGRARRRDHRSSPSGQRLRGGACGRSHPGGRTIGAVRAEGDPGSVSARRADTRRPALRHGSARCRATWPSSGPAAGIVECRCGRHPHTGRTRRRECVRQRERWRPLRGKRTAVEARPRAREGRGDARRRRSRSTSG
jgi:uncharacterized protein (TIGR00288 family)